MNTTPTEAPSTVREAAQKAKDAVMALSDEHVALAFHRKPSRIVNAEKIAWDAIDALAALAAPTVPAAEAPKPSEPSQAQIVAAAKMLNKIAAGMCQVDEGDQWKVYGQQFLDDAHEALTAAFSVAPPTEPSSDTLSVSEQDTLDARRYRWLRDSGEPDPGVPYVAIRERGKQTMWAFGGALDDAIDTEMARAALKGEAP